MDDDDRGILFTKLPIFSTFFSPRPSSIKPSTSTNLYMEPTVACIFNQIHGSIIHLSIPFTPPFSRSLVHIPLFSMKHCETE